MKLKCTIIEITDCADSLRVESQGQIGRASWSPYAKHIINVPVTKRSQKAFYIGRELEITVRLK